MATIKEVASYAGVSVGTVSRYINGIKVRDKNADAISEAIEVLDYHPNLVGRALNKKKSYTIGIIASTMSNVFVSSCVEKLEKRFEEQGYSVIITVCHKEIESFQKELGFLQERMVDGLIIFATEMRGELFESLDDLGIPIVAIDNLIDYDSIYSIYTNNSASVCDVVDSMLGLGHRRVGIVVGSQDTFVGRERLDGWRMAYRRRGLVARDEDVRICDSSKEEGYRFASELLDAGEVTALFAGNYYIALGAMKALFERSIVPGVDIGFASFDDFDFYDVLSPSITVVSQPLDAICNHAVEVMGERITTGSATAGHHVVNNNILYTESICGGLEHPN